MKKITLAFIALIGIMLLFEPTSKATTDEKVLEDGNYIISSSINDNLVVTVKNAQQEVFTNVELETKCSMQHQKFHIEYLSDGYYKIEAMHSGKVLDVYGGAKINGTNVEQYDWNNSDAQKWKIEKTEEGFYSFVSKCGGLYLDVYAGLNKSGTNIQTYQSNQSKSQKFKLEKVNENIAKQTLEDGIYSIHMSVNYQKILQVLNDQKSNGAQVGIWDYNKNITQKYYITYLNDGYYQIKSLYSQKVLDVYAALKYDGAKVDLYEWNNSDAQKWIIRLNEDGTYSIISKCNGLFFDIYGGGTNKGTKTHMYSGNESKAQKFIFEKEEDINPTKSIEDGIYCIKTSYNESKVLEVQDSQYQNFANLQISTNQKAQNQKFRVEEIQGTGYYKIRAIDSGKYLDVYAGAKENSTNVDQYEWNDSDAQKWIIKENGDNTYTIISKCNELAVDVVGGYSADGTNVQTYMPNNSKAQKFIFEQVQIIEDGEYELETKLKADQVIDIAGGSIQNATRAQIWETSNVEQQKFYLTYIEDVYTIKAKHSNKVLTAGKDGSVYQYDYTGELGQRWQIEEAGNGYYYIISELNNLCLTVENALTQNGNAIVAKNKNELESQKFKIFNGIRRFFEEGTYGESGLTIIRDSRGSYLKYYKFGKGKNVLFATYSIHGFEDSYDHDGKELTYIADEFKKYLQETQDIDIFYNWQIYLFPTLNPDGQVYGWTNEGPGRTTLVSSAPKSQGIDMNRNWQIDGVEYVKYKEERNYNGTAGFQAYEARALRDFLLEHKSIDGQTVLVDLHGWLNETMGDDELGRYYRNEYNITKHIETYGRGYLINWARMSLGGDKSARSVLVELPQVYNHEQVVSQELAEKYISATMQMLNDLGNTQKPFSLRKMSEEEKIQEKDTQKIMEEAPSESGMYITETSRTKFKEILEKCDINAFVVNENGYLEENGEQIKNELEQELKEVITNGKRYIIDVSDICYIRDEVSNKIVEYPFVEMEPLQICEPFEKENTVLLFINTNKENKIEPQEIIKTILQY